MFIVGLGTATPQNRFTQAECWQAAQLSDHFLSLTPRSRAIVKKVLGQQRDQDQISLHGRV